MVPKDDGDWDWHWAMKKRERKKESWRLRNKVANKPANLPAPDLDAPISYDIRRIVASQLHRMRTPQPTAMVDEPTSRL